MGHPVGEMTFAVSVHSVWPRFGVCALYTQVEKQNDWKSACVPGLEAFRSSLDRFLHPTPRARKAACMSQHANFVSLDEGLPRDYRRIGMSFPFSTTRQ